MSRKVLASLLSFILVLLLVVPQAGAAEGQAGAAGKGISSGALDHSSVLEQFRVDKQLKLQDRTNKASTFSLNVDTNKTPLQLEKIDSPTASSITPHNYVPQSDSKSSISVIVELQEQPVKVYEATTGKLQKRANLVPQETVVKQEQLKFKTEAAKKLTLNIKREYSNIFNGFALTIPASSYSRGKGDLSRSYGLCDRRYNGISHDGSKRSAYRNNLHVGSRCEGNGHEGWNYRYRYG